MQTSDGVAYPATGFLGAMIGGVLAGMAAHWIASWKVPIWARGLMPVLVIPLLASLMAGLTMMIVLGKPISVADGPARPRVSTRCPAAARSCSAASSA